MSAMVRQGNGVKKPHTLMQCAMRSTSDSGLGEAGPFLPGGRSQEEAREVTPE
jgi:hypothetical protein